LLNMPWSRGRIATATVKSIRCSESA
jgi:hypothetical protein